MPAHLDPAYAHYPKQAVPRETLRLGASELKLYHVEKVGEPVPDAVAELARARLAREAGAALGLAGPALGGERGFVILHRCGADFYFLLPVVWRGNNEGWEAVWYLHGDMADFAPFDPAYGAAAGAPRPAFCVWELGVVAHEAAAWSRFLASPRDEADLARWRDDLFAGAV